MGTLTAENDIVHDTAIFKHILTTSRKCLARRLAEWRDYTKDAKLWSSTESKILFKDVDLQTLRAQQKLTVDKANKMRLAAGKLSANE